MRRRRAFTLVELLVAMALMVFMMLILAEAFGVGLDSFRRLKAIGDMNERLRGTASALRRDLQADHFEGKRRLSDAVATWNQQGAPREGFFRNWRGSPAVNEGNDANGLPSTRATGDVLHFTVKYRGNERGQFAQASVPNGSPLVTTARTTFFDQPGDARYQDEPLVYQSQWAEVAYFLMRNDESAGSTTLYALYRSQFVVVADNSRLNWPSNPVIPGLPILFSAAALDDYAGISCKQSGANLFFNNPTDLATTPGRRAFNPAAPDLRAATLMLTDVISFDVQTSAGADFTDATNFDTALSRPLVLAIKITIRVWDVKTRQARQVTIIQDM